MSSAAVAAKSPDAFRTISEVATELDVPQHVLRFWESRFAQVRPIKRAGGRRYYRPEDVDLLRGIRTLLYREGYTIKGAQKVMRDKGPRYVAEMGRAALAARIAPSNVVPFEDVQRRDDLIGDEPRHARATLAMLEQAHLGPAPSDLAFHEREKLEALLADLLRLKSRLGAARTRS